MRVEFAVGWLLILVAAGPIAGCALDSHRSDDSGMPPNDAGRDAHAADAGPADAGQDSGRRDAGDAAIDANVICCEPSPQPDCCMSYGGAEGTSGCGVTCDGMPLPSAPWRLGADAFGCPTWIEPPLVDGECCGCVLIEDGGAPTRCDGANAPTCDPDQQCVVITQPLCGDPGPRVTCIGPVGCNFIFDPVCGCDGMTYPNACAATGNGIDIFHSGACE